MSGSAGEVAGLVLAAGRSRRMGSAKLTLPWRDGRTVVEAVVAALRDGGVGRIGVVVGGDRRAVEQALAGSNVEFVENPRFADDEMLGSIQVGLRAMGDDPTAALLFPGGSFSPPGPVTVAVFASVPVALLGRVPVAVKVTVPPARMSTVALMSPDPLPGQLDPADAAQVQLTPVSTTGNTSATVAPVTAVGPAFDAAIVYVTGCPGTAPPDTLVMPRSAVGVMTVLLSVAALFPAGSFTPAGAVTLAVFVIVPAPLAVAVTVNVAVPPLSRLTLAPMFPLPAAGQLEPPDAAQVQVTELSCAGNTSLTVAPTTALGPALLATIVYVSVPPWLTPVTPSVFVIARSAVGVMTVLLSVALLFPTGSFTPAGAVTVAVLVMVPAPVAAAVTVNVAVPPLRRSTRALRFPLPLAGQLEPADAAHVHVTPESCAGKASVTVAPTTPLGPALLTTIV